MRKLYIEYLMIEATRKCNFISPCKHCLRGQAQNKVISEQTLQNIFKDINEIFSLQLTGGETFLVPEVYRATAKVLRANPSFILHSHTVTTNGTISNPEIEKAILEIDELVTPGSTWISSIKVSDDEFHEKARVLTKVSAERFKTNKAKLKKLVRKFRKGTFHDSYEEYDPLDMGCAENLKHICRRIPEISRSFDSLPTTSDDMYIKGVVTVNVDGNVILTHSLSYKRQEKYILGNVNQEPLYEILDRAIKNPTLKCKQIISLTPQGWSKPPVLYPSF